MQLHKRADFAKSAAAADSPLIAALVHRGRFASALSNAAYRHLQQLCDQCIEPQCRFGAGVGFIAIAMLVAPMLPPRARVLKADREAAPASAHREARRKAGSDWT